MQRCWKQKAPDRGPSCLWRLILEWLRLTAPQSWRGMTGAWIGRSEAVAINFQNVDVMGQPIEQCAGEPLGSEHRCPLGRVEKRLLRQPAAQKLSTQAGFR